MTSSTIGFIILRHVNSELTNKFWIISYERIRHFYPENHIIIIDDNSKQNFITDKNLYKTTIINSEYHKRGELLPYYYYINNKLFDVAVIIHDTVFINKYLDFDVEEYKLIWEFENIFTSDIEDERKMINIFNDTDLSKFYENKELWKGCFGGMSIIRHEFLTHINNKYDISKLLGCILNRTNRMSFERVIACILQKEGKKETLLGNIHKYCKWGTSFHEIDVNLPLIKIWLSRE